MVNFTFDDDFANWEACETLLVPPACLPEAISPNVFFAHELIGYLGLLPYSIKQGLFLKRDLLVTICKKLKVQLPSKKQGSGKKGGLVKLDYAQCLVKHFFPEATEKDHARMVTGTLAFLSEDFHFSDI